METNPRLNNIYMSKRLRNRLNEINHHQITSVIGPMGFGKTTGVNWWIKEEEKKTSRIIIYRHTIVSSSIGDFWAGFCRIFKDNACLADQLKTLGYPKDMVSISLLGDLLNDGLIDRTSPTYFIIDDLHLLGEETLAPIFLFLSRSLPENIHLLLLSRNQIFTEEERMRLGNLLCEIDIEDLRLNEEEVGLYAKKCQLDIKDKELKSLAEISEGWISMIYLNFKSYIHKGKWLSNSSDIFTLIDQVLLDPLPDEDREFLILIGMADEFTVKQAS